MHTIAIVGSRAVSNNNNSMAAAQARILGAIRNALAEHGRAFQVISGGAFGVDSMAIDIAKQFWLPTKEYLPTNTQWEPDGYKARNKQMAEACNVLYCIQSRDATSYGSGWTAEYAQKIGKRVLRFWV